MFGKRSTSAPDTGIKAPAAPAQRVASAPPLQPALEPAPQSAPKSGNVVEGGRSPIPSVGLGAPCSNGIATWMGSMQVIFIAGTVLITHSTRVRSSVVP